MKKTIKDAVHKHERTLHPGKPLTKLAKGGKAKPMPPMFGPKKAKV